MVQTKFLPTPVNLKLIDPSELLRPEAKFAAKDIGLFRDYSLDVNDPLKLRVHQTYRDMHTNQTVEFVKGRHNHWLRFDKFEANIMDALMQLNDLIDESDPDIDIPNVVHAFQTAERIRENHPDEDWFHLTGLIHDLGKIMAFYGEPQWAVVGDTFPVGCGWADSIVYRESSFENNPDRKDERFNTEFGIYSPECGLENLTMSWGHDEYMYQVLKHNKCYLPEEALNIIRFHSFYPWHTGGDYTHLCCEKDERTKEMVLEFNKYDLYSKCEEVPDMEILTPYYQSLIDRYVPGTLKW